MLWTISVVLLVLWALSFGLGGAAGENNVIHIPLAVAVIAIAYQLLTARRARHS